MDEPRKELLGGGGEGAVFLKLVFSAAAGPSLRPTPYARKPCFLVVVVGGRSRPCTVEWFCHFLRFLAFSRLFRFSCCRFSWPALPFFVLGAVRYPLPGQRGVQFALPLFCVFALPGFGACVVPSLFRTRRRSLTQPRSAGCPFRLAAVFAYSHSRGY